MHLFWTGIILLSYVASITCLECFTCSATTMGTLCETDPSNVKSGSSIVDCHKGHTQCCMIQRQESNTKKGTVHSLFRGCQENCSLDNFGSIAGPRYTSFYTYCSEPLCNGGIGNVPTGKKDPRMYTAIQGKETVLEPEINSSSRVTVIYLTTALISIIYLTITQYLSF